MSALLILVSLLTVTLPVATAGEQANSRESPRRLLMQRGVMDAYTPGSIIEILDPRVFWALVSEPEGVVLVAFTSPRCFACRIQEPALQQFALERPDVLVVAVDPYIHYDLAWRHEVQSIPATAVWRDGILVKMVHGGLETGDFARLVGPPRENAQESGGRPMGPPSGRKPPTSR
ncbi:MAG: thioredoxin family protein [Rectinema sp.]|nr:thioredoxin family protein [Rectinema sp.]